MRLCMRFSVMLNGQHINFSYHYFVSGSLEQTFTETWEIQLAFRMKFSFFFSFFFFYLEKFRWAAERITERMITAPRAAMTRSASDYQWLMIGPPLPEMTAAHVGADSLCNTQTQLRVPEKTLQITPPPLGAKFMSASVLCVTFLFLYPNEHTDTVLCKFTKKKKKIV